MYLSTYKSPQKHTIVCIVQWIKKPNKIHQSKQIIFIKCCVILFLCFLLLYYCYFTPLRFLSIVTNLRYALYCLNFQKKTIASKRLAPNSYTKESIQHLLRIFYFVARLKLVDQSICVQAKWGQKKSLT